MDGMIGQLGDVSFGSPDAPLIDWRAERDPNEVDEIDEFREETPEEKRITIAMLGFDPTEEMRKRRRAAGEYDEDEDGE